VDGNDFFAVYEATRAAVKRARDGEGPTLIETRTYRMGPHNTADDPTRYVDPDQLAAYRALDPIDRLRAYLEAADALKPGVEERMREEIEADLAAALQAAEAGQDVRPEQIFDHVYADPPDRMVAQRRALLGEEGRG
jgi:pyruvate dehydrogenase E1 component alpha subunit